MNKKYLPWFLCFAIIAITIPSFSSIAQEGSNKKEIKYYNDLARYIAGMPLPKTSKFYPLTKYNFYRYHKRKMDQFWNNVNKKTITNISNWRDKYIGDTYVDKPVFYPFSGADFVNVYTFFPKAPEYIMIARERIGRVPDFLKMNSIQINGKLSSIRRYIRSISKRNYLVFEHMETEEIRYKYMGVTPVLLMFAPRMNLKITGIDRITLNSGGTIIKNIQGATNTKGTIPGMRIKVQSIGGPEQSLIYLKMNLNNYSLRNTSPLGIYLRRFTSIKTFIKAAMYVLNVHLRKLGKDILKMSCLLIQDDSGIPYRYINNNNDFNISLFGKYDIAPRLSKTYRPPQQNDLRKSYNKGSIPISFQFSYGIIKRRDYSHINSNLTLAIRKNLYSEKTVYKEKIISPLKKTNKKEKDRALRPIIKIPKKIKKQKIVITQDIRDQVFKEDNYNPYTLPEKKEDKQSKINPKKADKDTTTSPEITMKKWSRPYSLKEIYLWGRSMSFNLRRDLPPKRDNRAYFINQYGSSIKIKNLLRGRSYSILIDFVTFHKYNQMKIPTTLKIFHNNTISGKETLLRSINYHEIANRKDLYKINIPTYYSITGEIDLTFKEYSPLKSFWGIWDIVISDNLNNKD